MRDKNQQPREEEEELPEGAAFGTDLYFWLQALVMALVTMILLSAFVGRVIKVDGSSMLPTLHHGDMLLLQSLGYEPQQGDVVVLTTRTGDLAGKPIVKRVIAVAGQTVDIDYDNDVVRVDGEALDEPYINELDMRPSSGAKTTHLEVPPGSIFVMGDNRNNSTDSRFDAVGAVDVRCVLGGAKFILLPFHDLGPVESISQTR